MEKSKIDKLENFIDRFINIYKENLEMVNRSNLILKKYKVFEKENSRLESNVYLFSNDDSEVVMVDVGGVSRRVSVEPVPSRNFILKKKIY